MTKGVPAVRDNPILQHVTLTAVQITEFPSEYGTDPKMMRGTGLPNKRIAKKSPHKSKSRFLETQPPYQK